MSRCFCSISRQQNIGFSNCFFLLKTEIHTLVLNTQTFLSDFWGLRYLRNKMGFLIRWFWSKLKLFDLELPQILKTIEIKLVITSIQLVWVTRPTRSHLGAIRACFGPVCGAWRKICCFKAPMRQYEYEMINFKIRFCFFNISAPRHRSKMFEYSTRAYGSQFSGEKNGLKIRYLVAEILSKNGVLSFCSVRDHLF